jgi:aminoglycoside phosphotransferase (APT) family kinase protein
VEQRETVERIVAACGLEPAAVARQGEGVTSVAWRVETNEGPMVVRIERPERPGSMRNAPARFDAQFALLSRLRALDARVPRPIATNRTVPADPLEGRAPWAVDALAEGAPFHEAGSPAEVARDLGALLATLHALPADGFGMLEDRPDLVRGSEEDAERGLLSRWATLWPFDGTPLIAHPVAPLAPHLVGSLGAMREQLLRYLDAPARSVCHGDLHGEHILERERRLGALIDFGDAFVAHPAWDVASFAHHNGWALTESLLEGYEPRRLLREVRLAEARQLAVALALQKVLKWRERDPARVPRMLAFLEETVPLAVRREA